VTGISFHAVASLSVVSCREFSWNWRRDGSTEYNFQYQKNKIKQNKTKQNKTKQNKTKQNKTKQNKTKQNKTKINQK
jgi:preprotein translocase subunit SecF